MPVKKVSVSAKSSTVEDKPDNDKLGSEATKSRVAAEQARRKSVQAAEASKKAAEELTAAQQNATQKSAEADEASKAADVAAQEALESLKRHLQPAAPPTPNP